MKRFLITLTAACSLLILSLSGNAANKLRFGVIYFYPPFVFSTKSGHIHGFDIAIAKEICHQLHAECTFKPMPLSQAFQNLNQGKVDVIMGAISITPVRKAKYEFSRPYLKSTMSFVTHNTSQVDPARLAGKRVGVVKDSTFFIFLYNKYGNAIKLKAYETNEQLATALSNKEIDVMLLDTPAANYWIGYSMGLFKMVGKPAFLSFDEGYAIAAKKGNTALIDLINNALNIILKNGKFEKIRHYYFSKQPPQQQPRL